MLRCIAVEDEPLALDLLEDNIKRVPFLQLVKRCKNAFEATEALQKEQIDLIFLDIQMPGITGLQFLKSLQTKPMVIFITAYKNYAHEGFELDVLDYLVKPVSFERFLRAANKAHDYYYSKNVRNDDQKKEYIFVYSEYNLIKLIIKDIAYIAGLKDYIKIYLTTSIKPVITRLSIKAMEEKLPSKKFIRTHKSYVVAVDQIKSIRNNKIKLENVEIPLSEHYKEAFFKIIDPDTLLS
ncbi:MAG TPA: response regulator [Bacteroidia bacterium]|jgi:DNA-binding LytR/AlgR family response regulator|nr:response regulator [Bacteroidia bacterium]